MSIERGARAAVNAALAEGAQAGRLAFAAVNRAEPAYDRLALQYELVANSVVLVEVAEGRQTRWRNLEAVWDYAGDEAALLGYVSGELAAFRADH
jgi:hypothetical protein